MPRLAALHPATGPREAAALRGTAGAWDGCAGPCPFPCPPVAPYLEAASFSGFFILREDPTRFFDCGGTTGCAASHSVRALPASV